jgi:hypothetical protein
VLFQQPRENVRSQYRSPSAGLRSRCLEKLLGSQSRGIHGESIPPALFPREIARANISLSVPASRPVQLRASAPFRSPRRRRVPSSPPDSRFPGITAMYRAPRPRSTAAGVPVPWIGSVQARHTASPGYPGSQIESGRDEAVGDESQLRRSPVDLLNGEEFHGEDAYTGEFMNPFLVCSLLVWEYVFLYCVERMNGGVTVNLCTSDC